jgi:hypothetical protein
MRIEDEWARRAQVQLQVQQYASIYEACIHHLLFTRAANEQAVLALLRIPTLKAWSVSGDLQERLAAITEPDGRRVVAAIESTVKLEETKVRFDSKARAAAAIGIIDTALAAELVDFYAARNMIHIHAELKRGVDWSWEIEFAKQAYWRLEKFAQQSRHGCATARSRIHSASPEAPPNDLRFGMTLSSICASFRRMRSSTDLVTRQVTSGKRWIHLDRTRGSWGLTGRSLPQGSGALPADPRRPMLP